ncbi:MAG: hypothetical protein IRY99_23990, partial [Isosphaeraceae bacterium]|nr:hypothetical protein [Isosphaeraceae bacterium]
EQGGPEGISGRDFEIEEGDTLVLHLDLDLGLQDVMVVDLRHEQAMPEEAWQLAPWTSSLAWNYDLFNGVESLAPMAR